MEWARAFGAEREPTWGEISAFVGSPLWADLNGFLREGYQVEPQCVHSTCSWQPGWNVKYKKAGRALCTLYPMDGFFIAMIVIGGKEQLEAELMLPTLSEYVQGVYRDTAPGMGARWLMISVTNADVLSDVKRLIQARRPVAPAKPIKSI